MIELLKFSFNNYICHCKFWQPFLTWHFFFLFLFFYVIVLKEWLRTFMVRIIRDLRHIFGKFDLNCVLETMPFLHQNVMPSDDSLLKLLHTIQTHFYWVSEFLLLSFFSKIVKWVSNVLLILIPTFASLFLFVSCGKTTQVPQFILDEALMQKEFSVNIICTQPRRISAMAVAQRVADERCEKLGKCIGYKIRLESVAVGYLMKFIFSRLEPS